MSREKKKRKEMHVSTVIVHNEKRVVERTCISGVCCYILTGTKQNENENTKKKEKSCKRKTWEMEIGSRVHSVSIGTLFRNIPVCCDVKWHTNSWVYGHTVHAYSHD